MNKNQTGQARVCWYHIWSWTE